MFPSPIYNPGTTVHVPRGQGREELQGHRQHGGKTIQTRTARKQALWSTTSTYKSLEIKDYSDNNRVLQYAAAKFSLQTEQSKLVFFQTGTNYFSPMWLWRVWWSFLYKYDGEEKEIEV